MAQKLFVFDLDDTLMDNVHDYAQPILDAASYTIRVLGSRAPHVSAIIAMEQEIDKRRVTEIDPTTGKLFGYSMRRFPGTMVEVYRAICRRAGEIPKPKHEEMLYKIGMSAFDPNRYEGNIKPEAARLLSVLYAKSDVLVLLTKGDPAIQQKKIDALTTECCRNLFEKTLIVESAKTTEMFGELYLWAINQYACIKFYAVGNDYGKDIAPALEVERMPKYHGIFIPVETWELIGKMDEVLSKVDGNRCWVLNSLDELIAKYGELP